MKFNKLYFENAFAEQARVNKVL